MNDWIWTHTDPPMSLRDYFAAQAIIGIWAYPHNRVETCARMAKDAYAQADANAQGEREK